MPRRANSFSDDGRSMTPTRDDNSEDEAARDARASPNVARRAQEPVYKPKLPTKAVGPIHRTSSIKSDHRGIGAEPGIDPRRAADNKTFRHLRQACAIEVIDYSSEASAFKTFNNRDFIALLNEPNAGRPEGADIRWINIGGVSWDVMSAVATKYELHPLAFEDVLSPREASNKRSKADYYRNQLFLRVQCHTVADSEIPGPQDHARLADESELPADWDEPKQTDDPESARTSPPKKRTSPLGLRARAEARKNRVEALVLEELKAGERVHVQVSPMSIFLLTDGTVISMHPVDSLDFAQPISERLHLPDTVLRTSMDPSLLVQSLLDLIVDKALDVVDAYHKKIVKFEHDILVEPTTDTLRYLHILSGDLILHKRTLDPIKTMIYGLRRYDLDRSAALFEAEGPEAKAKVVGFMSQTSKIYLADVHDHMDYILTSLDMYSNIAENLINYSFNLASYQMNRVMWRLTAVTIICLPLTLLTGYFGMNFEVMWAIAPDKSDAIFWYFALPIIAVLVPLLMHAEIRRAFRVVKDKMSRNRINKNLKDD